MTSINSPSYRAWSLAFLVLLLFFSPAFTESKELEAQRDGNVEHVNYKTPEIDNIEITSWYWQKEIQKKIHSILD